MIHEIASHAPFATLGASAPRNDVFLILFTRPSRITNEAG